MYSLETMSIVRGGNNVPITKLEVWFHIPGVGMAESITELKDFCSKANISTTVATAVPVAVTEDNDYEVLN